MAGPPDTVPIILLRHASAGAKDSWAGDDLDRPLDAEGAAVAERLAGLLSCLWLLPGDQLGRRALSRDGPALRAAGRRDR